MSSPKVPTPPDPAETVQAQQQANATNQRLNALGQTGTRTDAQGNSVITSAGDRIWVQNPDGAYTHQGRKGDWVTPLNVTTQLSDRNQQIFNAQQGGQKQLADAFQEEAGDIKHLLRQDTDYTDGLPAFQQLSFAGLPSYGQLSTAGFKRPIGWSTVSRRSFAR